MSECLVDIPLSETETGGGDYQDYLAPRGSAGRVPWVHTMDLKLAYEPKWNTGLRFRMAVNNVTDSTDSTDYAATWHRVR